MYMHEYIIQAGLHSGASSSVMRKCSTWVKVGGNEKHVKYIKRRVNSTKSGLEIYESRRN